MIRVVFLAMLVSACAAPRSASRGAPATRVDHVVIGAADLDAAVVEMERLTGVRAAVGGVHPDRGTRNALMSLGDGTYLEILAPDPEQTVDNDELRELRGLTRPTPIGWAVSSDDERMLRTALGHPALTAPVPGSRARPDGSTLRWVTFGYAQIDSLLAPFFIVWADPALHPSRTSPRGCRLSALAIATPQAEAITTAIAPLALPVQVEPAATESMRIALSCRKGRVQL